MEKVFERVVSKKNEGLRLDQYMVKSGIGLSRNQVEKLIKEGVVRVNGKPTKPSYRVKEGDHIYARFEVPEGPELIPQEIEIPILYEDEDIVVVDKPIGMVVHPARGHFEGTLINALLYRYRDLPKTSEKTRPGVIHRLDKDTSGLMVVAKTDEALRNLGRQMEEKTAKRVYWAFVWGALPADEGEINAPIGRHMIDRKRMAVTPFGSRPAITLYRVKKRYDQVATWVEVSLKTGRTHQIRVHFEHLGYPVIGDPVYSGRDTGKIFRVVPPERADLVREILQIMGRQALHARKLSFIHPTRGVPVEFESPLPEDMKRLMELLEKRVSPQAETQEAV